MKQLSLSAVAAMAAATLVTATISGQDTPAVTRDRLVNAQGEADNWLMMNGDYGSIRYSKLTQITRANVKNLRLVWAMALGGMQDVGQNGPETEMHPLVDNGFLYTSDGWGTIYKIDGRTPNKGEFVWVTDPGVKHQGNIPRTRGIALWEDLVIANLPDGRVIALNRSNGEIVWDKMVATTNEFPIYDPQARPGDNLYTNAVVALNIDTGRLAWYFQYTPNDSWDFDEVGVHMLYDTTINGRSRKVVGHFARNGFYYSLDRTNGEFLKGDQYVNDLNWTKGLNPRTGKPLDYDPNLDVQIYNPAARALRGDPTKRSCPTWHGGIAHQPTAYNPVKHIAYGAGIEGCFSQNGAAVAFLSPEGGIDEKKSEKRTYSTDLYYGSLTAFDTVNHKVIAKVKTDIEIRSGATDTAGGLVFTALQDGWVVAYNDETLEELWRFNVGTPLKGAPVTYAIGSKQYLAVQSGGRHLHPVKFDKLENSSYLFVFALN